MKLRLLLAALPLVAAALPAAAAAAKGYQIEDFSTESLIGKAVVIAAWKEVLPEGRLLKLYPRAKYGFLSQVEGGVVSGNLCVVTARVSLLPKTSPTRRLVWEPIKTSTTYDGKTVASQAECAALAKAKLEEALRSLLSSLVKT
jgi:hypothetical protein